MVDEGDARPSESRGSPDLHLEAFRALQAVTKHLHASLDLTRTLDTVARGVVATTGFGIAVVNLFLPDGSFEVVSVEGGPDCREALLGVRQPVKLWDDLSARSRRWGERLHFFDHRDGIAWDDAMISHRPEIEQSDHPDAWHPDDALFAILTAPSGERIGALSVDKPFDGRRPSPERLEILELLADHAAIAIEHARMHSALQQRQDELRHAATHDSLTGLANRALLQAQAEKLAARPQSQLAVLVIDLDDFKRVNDSAGHQAGDEVLSVLAQRMRGCVRENDLLARTGGDEFVVVLSGEHVEVLVEQLVARLEKILSEPVHGSTGLHRVGASIGRVVAATPTDFFARLSDADADMYARKRSRNGKPAAP